MTDISTSLPPLVDTSGDSEEVLDALYEVFSRDFVGSGMTHDGLCVEYDSRCINEGKQEMFWHLTHYGYTPGRGRENALFDHDRSRRITWIRPIIESTGHSDLLVFDFQDALRGGNRGGIRRYVWFRTGKYYLVLQKVAISSANPVYRLVTANYLDFYGKERDLAAKYENRLR